jgi:hypothetical protein
MTRRDSNGSGIVVQASQDLVLEGAKRVISDFALFVEGLDGKQYTEKQSIEIGESLVFREQMDICPAILVATLLSESLWFIMTTSECPSSKCDDRQMMKCLRLNDQNLRIFRNFIEPKNDTQIITGWRTGLACGPDYEMIIDKVTRRWTH